MKVLLDHLRLVRLVEWVVIQVHVRIVIKRVVIHVRLRVQGTLFRIIEAHDICIVMRAQHILLGLHIYGTLLVLVKQVIIPLPNTSIHVVSAISPGMMRNILLTHIQTRIKQMLLRLTCVPMERRSLWTDEALVGESISPRRHRVGYLNPRHINIHAF